MKKLNLQKKKWLSKFGSDYTKRDMKLDLNVFEKYYIKNFGITKNQLNKKFYKYFNKDFKFLETGCNVGTQLALMKKNNFINLYGIDIQSGAIKIGKKERPYIKFKQGTSDNLEFKDNNFDVTLTNNFFIHLNKDNLLKTINEIYRVTTKYVWCFEYYSKKRKKLNYRGNTNIMWKDDFKTYFPKKKFKLIKSIKLPYISLEQKNNIDEMFLMEVIK
ncbi:methyltransferase domain-containing protein [Candidatus Pelagibacter sp.]|nr:methyltransferase domain-containing protein [Candidatus Pelagibacter sp.]